MEMYNINEAFKALEDLPQIGSEERTIFRYNDPEDLKDLELFIKDSESDVVEDPVEMVVDIDAEDEEDIKDTYVGDIILGCRACNTLIYKIEDQLEVEEEKDDDGNDIYNKGEECPHCHSTIGFKLIGKVAPYNAEESEELKSEEEAGEDFEDEEVFQSTESEPVEDEEFKEEEVEVKESLNEDLDKAKELIDVVKDQLEVVDRKVSGAQSNVEKIKDELDESCDNCKESEKEELKEEDKSAAISIDDAQKWVDYDMKRYGKISGKTNDLVKKAGFQIIKDDHGDYEVAAGKYESMEESCPKCGKNPCECKEECQKEGCESCDEACKNEECEDCKEACEEAMFDNVKFDKEVFGKYFDENGHLIPELEKEYWKAVEDHRKETKIIKDESCKEESCEDKEELEECDLKVENIDEELFDKLVNNYIKEVYDNVDSYVTTGGSVDNQNNQIVLEGKIKFKSGKEQDTKFVFEDIQVTKKGKIKLKGINETFAKMKKAFTLQGKLSDNNLLAESLTYNYKVNSGLGVKRIYGTERNKLQEELRVIRDFSQYEPWAGAWDTYRKIEDAGMLDVFEQTMEDAYPDGIDETELNDMLWFDGDNILEMMGLKEEEPEEDEEEVEESCKKEEELENNADYSMDNKVDKIFNELQDLAIEAHDRGEDYTADKLLTASDLLDDHKITEDIDLPEDIIKEIHDTMDLYFKPEFKDDMSDEQVKEILVTILNEPAMSEEGVANAFEDCSEKMAEYLNSDKEALVYEEAKRYLGSKMSELEEGCKKESGEEELTESEVKEYLDVNDQAKLDQIVSDHLGDAAYEAQDNELDIHIEDMEKAEAAFNKDFFFGESLQEDINSVVINQDQEDEIKLEADDIKEIKVEQEDDGVEIKIHQEPEVIDIDDIVGDEEFIDDVEPEISKEFDQKEEIKEPEMIVPAEVSANDEEFVDEAEANAEIEAEFGNKE